jgi:tRNA threonylcarbamoyl adenosine modification protein YjeE
LLKTLSDKKKKLLDLVVDFGKLPKNKPSTVVDLSEEKLKILREGDLNLKSVKQFISKTADQTKKISRFLFNKYIKHVSKKPLIFLIEGELGVGKTIFIKGIGEELGIDNIISPSFVIYYEYDIKNRGVEKLYHLDLYLLEEAAEFDYLHIERMLKSRTIVCIEWGEKIGAIYNLLKSKGKVVYIRMEYINEKKREIEISY